MRKTICVCDICGKEIMEESIFHGSLPERTYEKIYHGIEKKEAYFQYEKSIEPTEMDLCPYCTENIMSFIQLLKENKDETRVSELEENEC